MLKSFSVLLIGTQMTTGGAQRGLLDQARCFQMRGCRVLVLFLYDKDGLHRTWQQQAEFPIHNLQAYKPGAGTLQNTVLLLKGLFALWRLMRRERFDVVETFTPDSNLVGLPVAWLAGTPVRVATHRGLIENFPRWRQKLHTWMVNSSIVDVLIPVSESMGEQSRLDGIHPSKIHVITNGVTPLDVDAVDRDEVRKKLNLKKDDLFLLSVGRLAFQKGHDVLIASIPALVQHHPNLTVNICGDGPQSSILHEQIKQMGLSDRVKLLGTWSNVAPLLAIADVFILPSRSEGLSRALLEAMAAGLPIVATRVDSVEEVIVDGVHALLVPPEDPDALSKALIQMVDRPETRKNMGAAAHQLIMKSYTTDVMFEKYYELILKLLKAKRPSGNIPVAQ